MSRRVTAVAAVLLAALLGLTMLVLRATNSEPSSSPPDGNSPLDGAEAAPGMARSVPVSVRIPALGVQSTLIQLGLNADGTIEVPPVTRPGQAGWYGHGPTPGEAGPAVVLGHVDGSGQPGVFHDLHRLTAGDRIDITRADNSVASFAVRETTRMPKNGFPTQAVYGETPNSQLRLITCGGEFDRAAGSYVDNIVVYADLANTA